MNNRDHIEQPLVTVLMPVYNGGVFLKEAIESVLSQSFGDFEFLIIDDGSTDGSSSVIRSFEDPRIKLIINETNLKLIATLNRGMDLARGKYLVRMDADDVCFPDRIACQVNYMEENLEVGICGSFVQFIGQEQRDLKLPVDHENIHARLLFKPPIVHPSVIMNMDLIRANKLRYSAKYLHAEDFGLWTDAAPLMRISNIPKVLLKYRLSNQNITKLALLDEEKNDNVLKEIYKKQLHYAGVTFTDIELNAHMLASSNYKLIPSAAELILILQWLTKLYTSTRKTKVYTRRGMQYALAVTLLSVLRRTNISILKKVKYLLANLSYFSWWSVKNIMIEKGI